MLATAVTVLLWHRVEMRKVLHRGHEEPRGPTVSTSEDIQARRELIAAVIREYTQLDAFSAVGLQAIARVQDALAPLPELRVVEYGGFAFRRISEVEWQARDLSSGRPYMSGEWFTTSDNDDRIAALASLLPSANTTTRSWTREEIQAKSQTVLTEYNKLQNNGVMGGHTWDMYTALGSAFTEDTPK
jgi:hypothetical protein